jgi:hypothetical protein
MDGWMDGWMDRWRDKHDKANSHFLQFCKHAEKYLVLSVHDIDGN